MGAVLQVVNFACFCDFVSLLPTFAWWLSLQQPQEMCESWWIGKKHINNNFLLVFNFLCSVLLALFGLPCPCLKEVSRCSECWGPLHCQCESLHLECYCLRYLMRPSLLVLIGCNKHISRTLLIMIWTPWGECFKHIVDHCKVPVEKWRKKRGKILSLKQKGWTNAWYPPVGWMSYNIASRILYSDDFPHGLTKFGSLTKIAQPVIKQFNFQLKPQKSKASWNYSPYTWNVS